MHDPIEAIGPFELSDEALALVAGGGGPGWDPHGAIPDFDPDG